MDYSSLPTCFRQQLVLLYHGKSVGTSPKVRGPGKLRSHLEQKLIPLRYISTHICALLVLANHFLYNKCVRKNENILRTFFAEK